MTPTQRRLARHALGLPNKSMRSYRNRFLLNFDTGDVNEAEWASMADQGFAACERMANLDCYRLTRTGAELALEPGERLDEEDFGND